MKQYKSFQFKQFTITQNNAAMKVGTDGVLLGAWAKIKTNDRILDIGTGTGLLSLMLAQKTNGHCCIDAVEVEKEAIKDARENIEKSKWNKSIFLHNTDFNLYQSDVPYDVIISNPPFFEGLAPQISARKTARNASDKLSFENLISKSSALLKQSGCIYLILPQEAFKKVVDLAISNELILTNQLNIRPKANKPINRVLVELRKFSTQRDTAFSVSQELIIRNELNEYSEEHKLFTKEYYLKF